MEQEKKGEKESKRSLKSNYINCKCPKLHFAIALAFAFAAILYYSMHRQMALLDSVGDSTDPLIFKGSRLGSGSGSSLLEPSAVPGVISTAGYFSCALEPVDPNTGGNTPLKA